MFFYIMLLLPETFSPYFTKIVKTFTTKFNLDNKPPEVLTFYALLKLYTLINKQSLCIRILQTQFHQPRNALNRWCSRTARLWRHRHVKFCSSASTTPSPSCRFYARSCGNGWQGNLGLMIGNGLSPHSRKFVCLNLYLMTLCYLQLIECFFCIWWQRLVIKIFCVNILYSECLNRGEQFKFFIYDPVLVSINDQVFKPKPGRK